jgi:hypothetical protein
VAGAITLVKVRFAMEEPASIEAYPTE